MNEVVGSGVTPDPDSMVATLEDAYAIQERVIDFGW
jgi:hypothetical protein